MYFPISGTIERYGSRKRIWLKRPEDPLGVKNIGTIRTGISTASTGKGDFIFADSKSVRDNIAIRTRRITAVFLKTASLTVHG